jgi:hypothetical protein
VTVFRFLYLHIFHQFADSSVSHFQARLLEFRLERRPRVKQTDPAKRPEQEKPEQDPGILQPLIDEMTKPKPAPEPVKRMPPPSHPPEPAEQDQDAGGGYNPDHTIPQP